MQFVAQEFDASEAVFASKLPSDSIRNHRRHGFLPSVKGHPRYSFFDILKFAFVGQCSDFGIGPKKSYPTSDWIAHSALYYALRCDGAIANRSLIDDGATAPDIDEDYLSQRAARMSLHCAFGRPRIGANRFGVISANGEDYFCNSMDMFFEESRVGELPVLVLDVSAFAQGVFARMPGPIVTVQHPPP